MTLINPVKQTNEWATAFTGAVPTPTLLERFDAAVASITQERAKDYGDPSTNFRRITALQAVVADCPDPAARAALMMICVKLSRLVQSPDHLDSWIDIAGYARTGVMCLPEK